MILEKIECLDEYKLSMKSIYGHTDLSLSQKKILNWKQSLSEKWPRKSILQN